VPNVQTSKVAHSIEQGTAELVQANEGASAPLTISVATVVYVSGESMTPGGFSIVEATKVAAYSSSSLHVDSSAIPIQTESNPSSSVTTLVNGLVFIVVPGPSTVSPIVTPVSVLTIGNSVVTDDSSSRFRIGSQTLFAGGAPITVSGTPISSTPSATALVAGSSNTIIGHGPDLPVPTIGYQKLSAGSAEQYTIYGQTLTPGGLITISGTPVSLMPSASGIVLGFSTSLFLTPPHNAPVITVGNSAYTADAASNYVIDGQTLAPGSAVTRSGTPISLMRSASGIVVASSTSWLSSPTRNQLVVTHGSSVLTANAALEYVINSQILANDSATTISGTVISIDAKGTAVTLGTSTQTAGLGSLIMNAFGTVGRAPIPTVNAAKYLNQLSTLSPLTIDKVTFSADASEIVLSSTTYAVGAGATPTTVVVGNETLSLGPSGVAFPSTTVAIEPGTGMSPVAFTGGASREYRAKAGLLLIMSSAGILLMVFAAMMMG